MTDAERLTYLKMIQEDIYVCSLDATFLHISKECALTATIKELEKKISDNAQKVDAIPLSVIKEIKAEIMEQFEGCDICRWDEDYDYEENNISEYKYIDSISSILKIIDEKVKEQTS